MGLDSSGARETELGMVLQFTVIGNCIETVIDNDSKRCVEFVIRIAISIT